MKHHLSIEPDIREVDKWLFFCCDVFHRLSSCDVMLVLLLNGVLLLIAVSHMGPDLPCVSGDSIRHFYPQPSDGIHQHLSVKAKCF